MRAVDQKPEYHLEWPYVHDCLHVLCTLMCGAPRVLDCKNIY